MKNKISFIVVESTMCQVTFLKTKRWLKTKMTMLQWTLVLIYSSYAAFNIYLV